MTKFQINLKSSNYSKDKETFLKELKQFNESKSIPYKIPNVNGVNIDLFLFYTLVQQRGGLNKVNQTDAWDSFLRPLKLPYPCINGSTLVKKIYNTYLEKYEKAKGPPGRDDDNDMEEDFRIRGRGGGGMPRVTFSGAYLTEAAKTGPKFGGPTERLALSLISPMPNEQDFAVNVCTVLAADHSNRLPLASTPHILDFLLAHAGVYNHCSLRDTIGRSYYEARGKYPHEFWRKRAGGGSTQELADETKFTVPGLEQPDLMVQALAAQNHLTDCLVCEPLLPDCDKPEEEILEDWVSEPSEEDNLFAPEMPGGAKCVYTQRVLQVASIIRSLSFHEENVQYLSRNITLIRFLLLCSNSWVGSLRQSGLDSLGNVSTELVIKEPATCLISRHILSTIQAALVSTDRARVLAALELLNKLAQNENNEDVLLKALDAKVYEEVCSLLTLRDIMVLICALECVYALTSLGERAAECVARVTGFVHTLVSLLTVEAQSYGPRACILMRVVETVSGPSVAQPTEENQAQAVPQSQPQPQTPTKTESRPAVPATPTPSLSPVSSIQQAHLQQQQIQENEQFALAWLRTTFDVLPPSNNSGVEAAEVYRQYVACCTKLNRKGVISPTHFPRLENEQFALAWLRTTFDVLPPSNNSGVEAAEVYRQYVACCTKLNRKGVISPTHFPRLENEQFALAWLRTTFDVLPPSNNSGVEAAEVYRQYVACCTKLNRKGVISPTHFPRLVRTAFGGTVGPNQVTTSAGTSEQMYIGIKNKNPAARTSQPAGPSSPILKAQLTNKNVIVENKQAIQAPIQQTPGTHPHLSQALETTAGTSTTLIKHLLAHKVSPASTNLQVTQRQQNQQRMPQSNPTVITQQAGSSAMDVDPESLIKCTTITPGGVASSTPIQTDKLTMEEAQDIDEQTQMTIKATQNKMLADLLEKKSNPPVQVVQMTPQMNPPTIQITESGQIVQVKSESNPILQLSDGSGQILPQPGQFIQVKNDQGQIIHLKNDQGQIIQLKNDQFQNPMGLDQVDGMEPPTKKVKIEEKREKSPQESVSKTAANLYAALAASALEDEEDLMPAKQEPAVDMLQQQMVVNNENPPMLIQEPILQVQQPTLQVQQPTLQVQQPTLQVQQPTLQVQQPTLQVQQPTLQVQQQTLQVQQPMLQVQPMDVQVQNIIASQGGQLILQDKSMGSQPTQFVQQPMQYITTPGTTQGGLSYITQNIQGNIMQPHKTIIIVQGAGGTGPLTLTVNNPSGLDEATLSSLISQATEAISQQQIIQNSGVIQSTQRVIVSQPPMVTNQQSIKTQSAPQLTTSQQPIITSQPQPHKAILNSQPPQLVMSQKQPTLITSNPQYVAVPGTQQIIVNAPMKQNVHRVVSTPTGPKGQENKPGVIQGITSKQTQQTKPGMRQVITRQPVMVGTTKIGEKEVIVQQPITEICTANKPKQASNPKPSTTPPSVVISPDENPWICHWRGCMKTFDSAPDVYSHCARTHVATASGGDAVCQWPECDRVPRRTFALLNHIHDRHCTSEALKALYVSRRNASNEQESKPVSLGYPPNAAMAALNKHATDFLNPRELMDENEGPVTKSIRLTAALILRNIVIYSNTGRRQLRLYEHHLATIALSSVEAARTISQVLYDMNNI